MTKIEEAMDRIKNLECPAGELRSRIAQIMEEYGIENKDKVEVKRYEGININGSAVFHIDIPDSQDESIVIIADSGMDDYVTKVTDAYLKNGDRINP